MKTFTAKLTVPLVYVYSLLATSCFSLTGSMTYSASVVSTWCRISICKKSSVEFATEQKEAQERVKVKS